MFQYFYLLIRSFVKFNLEMNEGETLLHLSVCQNEKKRRGRPSFLGNDHEREHPDWSARLTCTSVSDFRFNEL